jgi:hypothetical protein
MLETPNVEFQSTWGNQLNGHGSLVYMIHPLSRLGESPLYLCAGRMLHAAVPTSEFLWCPIPFPQVRAGKLTFLPYSIKVLHQGCIALPHPYYSAKLYRVVSWLSV